MHIFYSKWATLTLGLLASLTAAAPSQYESSVQKRQAASDRLVFSHFMVGIVADRKSAGDWDADMKVAKAAGIDAFALNIGPDTYTHDQLTYAYDSANSNGMKVFISFDFTRYSPGDISTVAGLIKEFGGKPGQLKVDNKIFVSSFVGDGLDVGGLRGQVGSDIYFAPNLAPYKTADSSKLDGALNWQGWDSDGSGKAPKPGKLVTVAQQDESYTKWLGQKGYIAPVSPWFFTHFGPEVDYSKNFVYPGDLLWYNRWNDILKTGPRFVEIITWNDHGESSYVGPLASKHTDNGSSKWVNDMPHNGWLEMAKPYIAAYKAKASAPKITEDKLVYWYRPTPKSINCDSTDTTMQDANNSSGLYYKGRPDGWDTFQDQVFVVALLTKDGKVTVSSGKNTKSFDAKAGASAFQVDMAVGQQKFTLERDGKSVMSETSLRDISSECRCGIYNFNAFVGTVPAGAPDALDADGLSKLTDGLKVSTCKAAPSLTGKPPSNSGGAAQSTGNSGPTMSAPTASPPTPTQI